MLGVLSNKLELFHGVLETQYCVVDVFAELLDIISLCKSNLMVLSVYFEYYLNLRSANRSEVTEWIGKDSGSCGTPFYFFYRVRSGSPSKRRRRGCGGPRLLSPLLINPYMCFILILTIYIGRRSLLHSYVCLHWNKWLK